MKKSIRAAAAAMLIPILLTLTGCSLTVDGVMSVITPLYVRWKIWMSSSSSIDLTMALSVVCPI